MITIPLWLFWSVAAVLGLCAGILIMFLITSPADWRKAFELGVKEGIHQGIQAERNRLAKLFKNAQPHG